MVKVPVGHQSWCQEQFLSQGRWETKSFPQRLSCCSVGNTSLLVPLKHLSPNQSSLCGDYQELTSSLWSKIGLGWNSWVNTSTPGRNWSTRDPTSKVQGGTRPSAVQATAPKANTACFSSRSCSNFWAGTAGSEPRWIRSAATSANRSVQIPDRERPGTAVCCTSWKIHCQALC